MYRCEMRAAATTWLRRVRAFHALGMGVARLAGCDSLARKRPAKRTKARIRPEHASASIATSRRERSPLQAASIVHFFMLQHLGRLGHLGTFRDVLGTFRDV